MSEPESTVGRPSYLTLLPWFEELRGQRVVVRSYREADAADLQAAIEESREHLRPWLPFADAHRSVEESRDWIIQQRAHLLLRAHFFLCVADAARATLLGGIGLSPHDWAARTFEIGYWLRSSAEGHGSMTEAVRLLSRYALDHLHANRIEIRCDERNTRSAAIPQRLGFVLEARLRNHALGPDGQLRTTLIFAHIPGDPW